MKDSISAMVQRMANAQTEFLNSLMEQGFDIETSRRIFELYRREKFIKLDAAIGRYKLVHGIYWDKDVLMRAANYED